MVRLMIGAALAYGAYRIGKELLDSVPEIERGPNASDLSSHAAARGGQPKRRSAARRRAPKQAEPASA